MPAAPTDDAVNRLRITVQLTLKSAVLGFLTDVLRFVGNVYSALAIKTCRNAERTRVMSRVESNDEQRIREMQEAQRKAQRQAGEAQSAQHRKQAFEAALQHRQHHASTKSRSQEHQEQQTAAARAAIEVLRQKAPRDPHEISKRAALAKAFATDHATLVGRAQESASQNADLDQRLAQFDQGSGLEELRVRDVERDEEAKEVERVEEKLELLQQGEGLVVDPDGRRRRDPRDQQQDSRDEERTAAPSAVKATQRARPTPMVLPPENMKEIVSSVMEVLEDGRTRLEVQLQGRGLEGVKLEVRNEEGKVSCAFEGCTDRLRRQLYGASDRLKGALAKRGFKLVRFSAA